MGNKVMTKLVALVMALALVFTSGIAVFADTESPEAGAVTNVTTVGKTTSLNVKWKAAENAATYNIVINGKVVKEGVKGTSVTIKGLKAGKTYDVEVVPVTESGKEGTSSKVTSFTKKDGSAALAKRWLKKTTIKSVKAGKGQATITWKAVKGAAKYQVLQYKNGKWVVVKTVGKTTKATIKKLAKGKTYKFKVRALNKKGYVALWSKYKTTKKIK